MPEVGPARELRRQILIESAHAGDGETQQGLIDLTTRAAMLADGAAVDQGIAAVFSYDGVAPIVSLLGAALGGSAGALRSTKRYIPKVHAIAAVHPARMSDG